MLEWCRQTRVQHLVYALLQLGLRAERTDAVQNRPMGRIILSPLCGEQEGGGADGPLLPHLYGLPTTGLRFSPSTALGRPDMALFLCTPSRNGDPIDLYNQGQLSRDFTHVDDIVEGIVRISDIPPAGDAHSAGAPDASPAPIASSTSATAARSGCWTS